MPIGLRYLPHNLDQLQWSIANGGPSKRRICSSFGLNEVHVCDVFSKLTSKCTPETRRTAIDQHCVPSTVVGMMELLKLQKNHWSLHQREIETEANLTCIVKCLTACLSIKGQVVFYVSHEYAWTGRDLSIIWCTEATLICHVCGFPINDIVNLNVSMRKACSQMFCLKQFTNCREMHSSKSHQAYSILLSLSVTVLIRKIAFPNQSVPLRCIKQLINRINQPNQLICLYQRATLILDFQILFARYIAYNSQMNLKKSSLI